MTDVSNLDDLANKIASGKYPQTAAYAKAQAAASQSQETDIRKLREEVDVLKRSVSPPPDGGPPPPPSGVPANTLLPSISGTAQQGQTLTASNGTWSGSPTSYAYQWQRCDTGGHNCVLIAGATGATYVPSSADVGSTLQVVVRATNQAGTSLPAVSLASAVVVSASQPPPSGDASPLGHLSNLFSGYYPASNISEYSVVVAYGQAPPAFTGVNLRYVSSITCGTGTNGIVAQTALNNGWVLTDANGPLTNSGYGGYLADPGLVAYQQAWCQMAESKALAQGAEGVWCDDSMPRITGISGGRTPTKYPSDAAYSNALLTFYQAITAYMRARGLKTGWNCLLASDDQAVGTSNWFTRVGNNADYLTCEYWLTQQGFTRLAGTQDWWRNWDAWRNPHKICVQNGIGFLPLDEKYAQAYSLGTFMLDWDGIHGAHMWDPDGSYVSTIDPWSTAYAQARALGLPTAAATNVGNVWTRQFQGGSLRVDANVGSATFTVT